MRRCLLILLIPIVFFVVSLFTLKDYGVSWDEPEHFIRGQGYLYYFLTGNTKFPTSGKLSYYQNNSIPAAHFIENDSGHPPLNDILAALSNLVFYQKLGVLGDIESYHLFNIFASTLLVLVVSVFAYQLGGPFLALLSSTIIAFFPLFYAESKFNIKDPTQAAFYALTIYLFWLSLKKKEGKWLIMASVAFAFSLGMKFNILFLPFIIIPYLLIRYKKVFFIKNFPRKYLWTLVFCPIIVLLIFYGMWPFLWQDPIGNLLSTLKYYKEIGTGFEYQPGYYLGKFNLYPLIWILLTTPPGVIFLMIFGIYIALKDKSEEKTPALWLIWFLVPIIRVSLPGMSIYGGVRQIIEYLPAMALLCGLGGKYLMEKVKRPLMRFFVLGMIGFSIFYPIFKYHPYENVYFNVFIGGLRGAAKRNIPYWGNSYGTAYLGVVRWMNENAEPNAKLAMVQATALNIPSIILRPDITRWNKYWSGFDRNGEYLTELNYKGVRVAYPYAWDYVEKFLDPVYEVKVDGVAIAKLWKNDLEHTKPEMRREETLYSGIKTKVQDKILEARLDGIETLNRFVVYFRQTQGCLIEGRVETTLDDSSWLVEPEIVPTEQISERKMIDNGKMTYYFPARDAKGVRFISGGSNSCSLANSRVEVFVLE